jgi:hypothetical protein
VVGLLLVCHLRRYISQHAGHFVSILPYSAVCMSVCSNEFYMTSHCFSV